MEVETEVDEALLASSLSKNNLSARPRIILLTHRFESENYSRQCSPKVADIDGDVVLSIRKHATL